MAMRRRFLVVFAAVAALTVMTAAGAYAHECTNANKKAGAGSAGTVVINVETGEVDLSGATINEHSGRLQGGFATIQAVDSSGTVLLEGEVFAQTTLPAGAQNSGPGDNWCDGKGVDNVLCLEPSGE